MLSNEKFVEIRLLEKNDIDFIFNLNNEPLVRANSFNTELTTYKDHKEWFKSQLINNKSLFYIILFNSVPIGQVRFTIKYDYSVISVSISDEFRGKGYAFKSLELVIIEYFNKINKPIYAYIKKSNFTSVRLFEKLGFVCLKEEIVNRYESLIYIKEIR